ncbi:MAG: hypothetical protein ACW981_16280 [Candidatus Hodarchaeales archaeon]|jgi:hypothetical protein
MLKKFIVASLFVLLFVQVQPIIPVTAASINVYGCGHSPGSVEPGDTVTISCSLSQSGLVEWWITVYWRVNGGVQYNLEMTANGNSYSASIGSFSSGDFVEYRVNAFGHDNDVVYSDSDPYSGYRSFNVELQSDISWLSPANGATLNFDGENNPFSFSFNWNYDHLDDAYLIIGGKSFDILTDGIKTTSVSIDYASNLDGDVTATLEGYNADLKVASDSRSFNFVWVRFVDKFTEDSGNDLIGNKLYNIFHDPAGDQSSSNFAKTETVTMTGGAEVTAGASVTVKAGGSLFGFGAKASAGVSLEGTFGEKFEYSMSIGTALSSSQEGDDPAFIGPGRGDYYWGEAWVFYWEVVSTRTVYWSGDQEFTDPELRYGIFRNMEAFIGDHEAPSEWRNQNPVWNNYEEVGWIKALVTSGGAPFSETTTYQTTKTQYASITVTVSGETELKFGWGSTKIQLSLSTSLSYSETSENEEILGYTVYDDDPSDVIRQDIGIDRKFGTYIFKTDSDSTTSNPLEIGTKDYQAPIIDFPTISLDTDGISPSPSQDDSPLVTVPITDEGGISKAVVWYSTNGGVSFGRVNMTEQAGNPGTWQANLPKQSHGTNVNWYIEVWDMTNNAAIRKDVDNNDYTYTVVNRVPTADIVSPNGGETLSNSAVITWVGADQDHDELSYSLGYNLDNQGWKLIAADLRNNSIEWDISDLPDSTNVLVKVIVDDGFGGSIEDISNFVFSIDNADTPIVDINSPLSGLTYSGFLTINWDLVDVDDLVTTFDLYYSANSGVDWNLIETNIAKSTRDFDWNSSSVVFTLSARIKVVANYQVELEDHVSADLSDIFSIDNRPDLQVSLIYPNGGESIEDFITISWVVTTHPEVTHSTLLEYSLDGVIWFEIANSVEESTFYWTTHHLDYSTNYRVRVIVSGEYLGYKLDNIIDVSEGAFTINPDHETPIFNSPDNGSYEYNTVGHTLSWTVTDDNPYNYSILLDGGYLVTDQSWFSGDQINIGIDGLEIGTHEYILMAEDIWGQQTSDAVFITVIYTPPPPPSFEVRVVSPNGGEVIVNNKLQITWQLENPNSLSASFDLYYSSDDGNSWNLIINNLNTFSYQWNITELVNGPGYYVKVVATATYDGENLVSEDRTDNAFSIVHNVSINTQSFPTTIPGTPGFTLLIALFAPFLLILFRRKKK